MHMSETYWNTHHMRSIILLGFDHFKNQWDIQKSKNASRARPVARREDRHAGTLEVTLDAICKQMLVVQQRKQP